MMWWMPLLESGHRRWAHSLTLGVYELLSCLLSAAKAGVLYEKVFIDAESPSATSMVPHASLPPGQASPSPLLHQIDEITIRRTDKQKGLTQEITGWQTDRVSGWWRWCDGGHDGSVLIPNDGDGLWQCGCDWHWSLDAACYKTSRDRNMSRQRVSSRLSSTACFQSPTWHVYLWVDKWMWKILLS